MSAVSKEKVLYDIQVPVLGNCTWLDRAHIAYWYSFLVVFLINCAQEKKMFRVYTVSQAKGRF